MRKLESRSRGRKIFKKTATRTHKKNLPIVSMRGGIKL